ncbi:MAG: family 16 glycosylhydrolase [bacterium]|nr:family 16 glycosylhydrolase [Candidatus Kapabacteria bacterium]
MRFPSLSHRSVSVFIPTALSAFLCHAAMSLTGCSEAAPPAPDNTQAFIAGSVVGGLGGPIVNARVTTVPATKTVLTDPAGRFVIDSIDAIRYSILIERDSARARAEADASIDTAHVSVRLPIWRLTWSDEFTGDAVDVNIWHQPEGDAGAPDWATRYRRHAASVGEGRLRMTSTHDAIEPGKYSTAILVTREFYQYGRFEIRAKLPRGRGMWPAHWLWPLDKHSAPELDIMEMVGHDPSMTYMTYHFGNPDGTRGKKSKAWRGFDRSADYYTYSLEWYPGEARWLIDDVECFRTSLVQADEPMNLIICTAVGGDWPGDPDATTVFPQFHDVEFVRIYHAVE